MFGVQWRAIQREAQLAAVQAAHGATVLRRANHAQVGRYTEAFFALSISLERMGKLIFLADHVINTGNFPKDQDLRAIGHDLNTILDKCETIGANVKPDRNYSSPLNDPIHIGIKEVLSLFATKLRYYNLNYLVGTGQTQKDPIALWWEIVATPIIKKHFSSHRREKAEKGAALMESLLGDRSIVLHSTESSQSINDISKFWAHGQATQVVQKYGQLYTLQIIRWLSSLIYELSIIGAYEKRVEALLGLNEPFEIFLNNDTYLRGRKTWTVYM